MTTLCSTSELVILGKLSNPAVLPHVSCLTLVNLPKYTGAEKWKQRVVRQLTKLTQLRRGSRERSGDLPKMTQQTRGRARVWLKI